MSVEVRAENLESLFVYNNDPGFGLNWPSIFTLPVWLQTWWAVFGGDYELSLHSLWQDRVLIGIAPLMCRGEEACLLGSPDICDYLDFITVPGKEKEFMQALLPELRKQGIRQLELYAQRPDSVAFKGFFSANNSAGDNSIGEGQFQLENLSYELVLPSSWKDYLAGLSKKQRHEVRRKLRRFDNEAGGWRYRVITESEAVEGFTPVFFDLFQQNPEKANFLTEQMDQYFHLLINNMTAAGLARFGLLEIDGVVAAAVFYFDFRERVYLYNSGYQSDYGVLSAGLLSKILCIRDSIEEGRQIFDFLKGREAYKSRLGGAAIPIYKVKIAIS